jgi:hypothetical protein
MQILFGFRGIALRSNNSTKYWRGRVFSRARATGECDTSCMRRTGPECISASHNPQNILRDTVANKNRHRIAVAVSLKTNAGGRAGLHFWSSLLNAKA